MKQNLNLNPIPEPVRTAETESSAPEAKPLHKPNQRLNRFLTQPNQKKTLPAQAEPEAKPLVVKPEPRAKPLPCTAEPEAKPLVNKLKQKLNPYYQAEPEVKPSATD